MQQLGMDGSRRRTRPEMTPEEIGAALGVVPADYFKVEPSPMSPISKRAGGQLGRNIVLSGGEAGTANLRLRDLPLATRQMIAARQSIQKPALLQSLESSQVPTVPGSPVQSGGPAPQPTQRPLFDIAGKLHDFQAGPKIPRPNTIEEFIPVIGPLWDAAADLQDGHYGTAAFNAAMAVGDLFPVGYGIKAGREVWKLGKAMKTFVPKAAAIQRKMHKIGMAGPLEEVHHVWALDGLGRYVPSLKNSPLFLKVLPKEVHRRLHGRWGGQPKFGLIPRLVHGTTDWMKAAAAEASRDAGYAAHNFEQWLLGPQSTPDEQ